MYPFGHVSLALLLARGAELRYIPVLALSALLPDIDVFLPLEHRGITHSVLFIVAATLTARPLGLERHVFIGISSHLLVDPLGSEGIKLFYPLEFPELNLYEVRLYRLVFMDRTFLIPTNKSLEWLVFLAGSLVLLWKTLGRRAPFLGALLFFASGNLFFLSLR